MAQSLEQVWLTPETRKEILAGCKAQAEDGYKTCDEALDIKKIASQNYVGNQSVKAYNDICESQMYPLCSKFCEIPLNFTRPTSMAICEELKSWSVYSECREHVATSFAMKDDNQK